MLKHTLLSVEGILILEPSEALESADFEAVIHDMDPYLAEHDSLAGAIIFAKAFPGWLNLEAAITHLQLIANYHQKIKRLAIVSDNGLLTALPTFAAHLVHPDVKHFADMKRIAMDGETKCQHGMATFCKPFTKATVRYFDHVEATEAQTWLDNE